MFEPTSPHGGEVVAGAEWAATQPETLKAWMATRRELRGVLRTVVAVGEYVAVPGEESAWLPVMSDEAPSQELQVGKAGTVETLDTHEHHDTPEPDALMADVGQPVGTVEADLGDFVLVRQLVTESQAEGTGLVHRVDGGRISHAVLRAVRRLRPARSAA